MEKELGLPKPGDLLIGVIDFFAVLIPGVIAAALIVTAGGNDLQRANTVLVGGLITAGWVFGHVLHGIGSFLDPLLYDKLFRPGTRLPLPWLPEWLHKYLHKNDELFGLAIEATDFPHKREGHSVPGGMYQWTRAWLNFHNPKATADLDRLEADSKLFRSIAVLFLILIPLILVSPVSIWSGVLANHRGILVGLDSAAAVFSLWRYCDLRNKTIRQCYLCYVQLRFESQGEGEKTLAVAGQSS